MKLLSTPATMDKLTPSLFANAFRGELVQTLLIFLFMSAVEVGGFVN